MKVNKNMKLIIPSITTLVITFIVLVFFLILVNDPTYGWFASNNKVDASGMQISAKENEYIDISNMTVYRYNEDKTEVEKQEGIDADVSLDDYDSVFTERNKYLGIIVKLDINAKKTGNANLIVTCKNDTMDNFISDIICVKAGIVDVDESQSNTTIYNTVLSAFESYEEYTFASFEIINDEKVFSKSTSISIPMEVESTTSSIYFYINYEPELMSDIQLDFSSGSTNIVDYEGDLDLIYFDVESNK